jgi:hypothetical protein
METYIVMRYDDYGYKANLDTIFVTQNKENAINYMYNQRMVNTQKADKFAKVFIEVWSDEKNLDSIY